MAKSMYSSSIKVASGLSGLLAALLLLTNCNPEPNSDSGSDRADNGSMVLPPVGGPVPVIPAIPDVPVPIIPAWDVIQLLVKTTPLEPYDERFLDDWRFQIHNIDDEGRCTGPTWFGESGPDGSAAIGLPAYMFQLPMIIGATNDAYPLFDDNFRHHRDRKDHRHKNRHKKDGKDRDGEEDNDRDKDRDKDKDRDRDGDKDKHKDGGCHGDGCDRRLEDPDGFDRGDAKVVAMHGGHDHDSDGDDHDRKHGDHKDWDEDWDHEGGCNSCKHGHDKDKDKDKKDKHKDEFQCRHFEIFVPACCYKEAIWLLGPLENAVWNYYKRAAELRGEAWNPSQVDCATWLADLQLLIQTDLVNEELHEDAENGVTFFDPEVLRQTFRENQNFLVPTRPPICMAERRHTGGGLDEGPVLTREDFPFILDFGFFPFGEIENSDNHKPDVIVIDENGGIADLCGQRLKSSLRVNDAEFDPTRFFLLRGNDDFIGTVHKQDETVPDLNVRLINVRLGNGRPIDSDVFDDACAVTQLVEFTNIEDSSRELRDNTGVTFHDLFEEHHKDTHVHLTSDGDNVINDDDTWAILFSGEERCRERVLTVELLGYRLGDFKDVLFMERRDNPDIPDNDGEDLFVGLRADYTLQDETIEGDQAFMAYTLSFWDGSSERGREDVRTQIAVCYEAADVWARQFFNTRDFQRGVDDCRFHEHCEVRETICPLHAAEMAVRSQCFSNSRSNNRWQTQDVGFWMLNNTHGVVGNVVVNPGWLGPDMDFEIYIQRFDEAVFKGPRAIVTSDRYGQIMTALPTLVEGDRVLIKSQDACCSDYDVVLPCVPEFTGFIGLPGIPYVPQIVGPIAPPLPVVAPVVGGPGVDGPGIGGPGMGGPGMGGPGMGGPGMNGSGGNGGPGMGNPSMNGSGGNGGPGMGGAGGSSDMGGSGMGGAGGGGPAMGGPGGSSEPWPTSAPGTVSSPVPGAGPGAGPNSGPGAGPSA